jgi:hypothetical protein
MRMVVMTKRRQDADKTKDGQSSEKAAAVADVLAKAQGERVSVSIFFDDSVPAPELAKRLSELVDKAREVLPESGHVAKIGTISKLAKSVGLEADRDMLKEISQSADVKTVLPSEIEDIYPKPAGRKRGARRRE